MSEVPPPYTVPPATVTTTERRANGVGLAALIVGAVALLFAIIPLLSFIAWLPAVAAIVLGIIGLVLKGRKRLFAWLGLGLGVVAWIVAIVVSIASVAGLAGAISDAATQNPLPSATTPADASEAPAESPSAEAPAAAGSTVRYEVTSDDPALSSVSYFTINNGSSGQESATDATAPFVKEIALESDDGIFDYSGFSLVAQAGANATTITCTITVDGEVVSTQTSTGAFSVVTCTDNSL